MLKEESPNLNFTHPRLNPIFLLYHDTQMYHDQSDTKAILGFYYIANRPQVYSYNHLI